LGLDEAGDAIEDELRHAGVELVVVRSAAGKTTQKIRAVCRHHQLLRVDIEQPVTAEAAAELGDRVGDLLPGFGWVLLSDYGKGALADTAGLIRRAHGHGSRVLVDPKGDDFERYRGAWLLKPNQREAERITGVARDEADFDTRMAALRAQLQVQHLLVTRGELGMVLYSAGRAPLTSKTSRARPRSRSGAGDTVLAAVTAALAEGQTLDEALAQANQAAGIVVGKFGVATVSRRELARDRLGGTAA
jgi:rfaE bifunctional protein kinase chain/domain